MRERDACGIGFVADARGRSSRAIVELALAGLAGVRHRGAFSADGKTGDGAGLLLPLPATLLESPWTGVAMVFLRGGRARAAIETACEAEGLEPVAWRRVPIDAGVLGDRARESLPEIEQLTFKRPLGMSLGAAELHAYRARRRASLVEGAYVASLSFLTVTYKALCPGDRLAEFYADLRDPALDARFAIFHQRFSTNTTPSWERAQPFRLLCHNGEINAIDGNVNAMRARAGRLGKLEGAELGPVIEAGGSDSAFLDNATELLVRGGRDVRHALSMLVPAAWEGDQELDEDVRAFHRYHSTLVEPWDGPAALVFTDGRVVGATLDRNGLRPLRYAITDGGLVACASEAGAIPLPAGARVTRGRLGPGEMLAVDPGGAGIETDAAVKRRLAARKPYRKWLRHLRVTEPRDPSAPPGGDLTPRQVAAGYTREDVSLVLRPIAASGHEPVSSMGDDTALAPLAGRPRPVASYFRQRFAQVTNPPIDHLRERRVMSLRTLLGSRPPLLTESADAARLIELPSFFLFHAELEQLEPHTLDATFPRDLRAACERLADDAAAAARRGAGVLRITDRPASWSRAPIPALLAVGAVHARLVVEGLRTRTSLVVEHDEPRDSHQLACLLAFGADAICPRLALDTVATLAAEDRIGGDRPSPAEAQLRFREAMEDGVLKVLAKMGISDVASYRGALLVEAIGLAPEVIATCFPGVPVMHGGVGFAQLERDAVARRDAAWSDAPELENPGFVKFRKGGERHATNPQVVAALQKTVAAHELRRAVSEESWERYERFARLTNEREPMELRDLLELVPALEPVPLDEVEPAASIVRRFSGGAMSHGSLSAEAHETVAVALNRLRARSNSGEGGEDPARYRDERNSAIKQIASGRFGVTPEYVAYADELQIKIAQGSKPGEGGQLPGHKVTDEIARLRHTTAGVALISPPPHHDIYSIEDLAQLVFDLREANPRADVSVKLVSSSGVGVVAAGVVKALADVVHIAGADGGTGASPLSSIKNAGAPWELGLAETQRTLVEEGLRGRVRLRVDGGLKTGRDVVVAALLGADEYSFGTALLIAEGCLLVRACHLDTCPVGIATQKPELREKFAATPEMVMAYLTLVAEEARRHLAALGLRGLDEAVGRVDLLRARETTMDLDGLLVCSAGTRRHDGSEQPTAPGGELGRRLAADAAPALERAGSLDLSYAITNRDRAVGAALGVEIGRRYGADLAPGRVRARFTGAAGQSFGAFLASGLELELTGEANDGVGKGMGGGRIVVRAPEGDAGDPVLIGNAALYGATGGELYVAGRAGERFAVRNSGATAVVEGVGAHACEYMTAGIVVVLGEFGPNLAAGMSGGNVYVYDPHNVLALRLNGELAAAGHVGDDVELRRLVVRHLELTGSPRAQDLLASWATSVRRFRHVAPRIDVPAADAQGVAELKA